MNSYDVRQHIAKKGNLTREIKFYSIYHGIFNAILNVAFDQHCVNSAFYIEDACILKYSHLNFCKRTYSYLNKRNINAHIRFDSNFFLHQCFLVDNLLIHAKMPS